MSRCKFLGFIIDTKSYRIELPVEKRKKVDDLLEVFLNLDRSVEYGWLYTKALEREKNFQLLFNDYCFDRRMVIKEPIKQELAWWKENILSSVHYIKDELSTIKLALVELASGFEDCKILLRIDNTTAIAYINKMGGTRFQRYNKLAREIWQWAELRKIILIASYIPSKENIIADSLSRIKNIDTEWELNEIYYKEIIRNFGVPEIDLFASELNTKCTRFISWKPEGRSLYVDAFTITWDKWDVYAFPPFSLILKALAKIKREKAEGILVEIITSQSRPSGFNCEQNIREAFLARKVPIEALDIDLASLSKSTFKQYGSALKQWDEFCRRKNRDCLDINVKVVLEFLYERYKAGASYGTLNSCRSAISLLSKKKIGENAIICRLKGVYKMRPCRPKYSSTWDVATVLRFLESLNISLRTAQRAQALSKIRIDLIKESPDGIEIRIPDVLKTSGPGRNQPCFRLPKLYLERISPSRKEEKLLFISYKKPYEAVTTHTISRWVKKCLFLGGIDTTIFLLIPHGMLLRQDLPKKVLISIPFAELQAGLLTLRRLPVFTKGLSIQILQTFLYR
ncbi:uncharacterized protein LOC135161487 [Diachasmimorpha longicaudata]|uniref:uncharacterized protein LOC135161487 n=1 Tax=Diachasmimorpha longicaudata TaxID=58733 RepID=UPI0030B8C7B8